MAVTNYLVSALPNYVAENRDLIIKNFALTGSDTRKRVSIQSGVKSSMHLNFLDFNLVLQDGSSCGFNPLDEATLTARTLSVSTIKHDGEICPESLLGKYAEYLVRVNATENELPFEAYLMEAMTNSINNTIEKLIWQGDTQNGTGNMLRMDGWLVQMAADNDVTTATIGAGDTTYDAIQKVYLAMTEDTLNRGGVIFVSPALYRDFLQGLVASNLYHYSGPQDAAPEEYVFPGSDVRVIKTPGLAGSKVIVGTFAANLVYGTDVEGDEIAVDLWWSNDDRVFKYQVKWNSGVNYYFPDQIVIATAN